MDDVDPEGQGFQPDVPAAEVGQLMEEGAAQGLRFRLSLGQEEYRAEQPGQHGGGKPRTQEQPGAAVQFQ